MDKPSIGEMVVTGIQSGFSPNALVAAVLSFVAPAIVIFTAVTLGLATVPDTLRAYVDGNFIWVLAASVLAAGIVFQHFAVAVAERQLGQPSPHSSLAIILRNVWAGIAMSLSFLPLGFIYRIVLELLLRLPLPPSLLLNILIPAVSIVFLAVMAYVQAGFLLTWAFAVYERRFSVIAAYGAMRGNRWRMLAAVWAIWLPFAVLSAAVGLIAHEACGGFGLDALLAAVAAAGFVNSLGSCAALTATAQFYLWQSAQPIPEPEY